MSTVVSESAPGPEVLGRGVVVGAGQQSPEWAREAHRVRIDQDVLDDADRIAETMSQLREAYTTRTRVVVELAVAPEALKVTETDDRDPYELTPAFSFPIEQLRFLTWANNYDLRSGQPIWWHGELAIRQGAVPSQHADVIVDRDTHVWVDGGPRGPLDGLDVPLLHRESVEAGLLTVDRYVAPATELADDQYEAVAHRAGPARIVAPAGSGKTRVLIGRLRHLVEDRDWQPELITAVAYNTRAANEMRERAGDHPGLQVRTLHSLGFEIVRAAQPGVTLLDERAVRDLVARFAPAEPQPNTDVHAPYIEGFTQVRLGLMDPTAVEKSRSDVPGFADTFDRYREELKTRNAIDFDEQIYTALEVLLTRPHLRERFQRRCRHMLVDEFQDLTPSFLLLVRLLTAPAWQVFGVGDDDQVIYGYVGADPSFLVDYDRYFPGAADHPLEVNYRCPAPVVDAAATLLTHNRVRVDKTISAGPDAGDAAPKLVEVDTHKQAAASVHHIQDLLDDGAAPTDVAVLCRVNAMLLPVQLSLLAAGVPTASAVGPEILRRTGVRVALAWLRLATARGQLDGSDISEALRRSSRKIRGNTLKRLTAGGTWNASRLRSLAFDHLQVWEGKELRGWRDEDLSQVVAAARVSTASALTTIRDIGGLDEAADELDRSARDSKRASSHLDDLDALVQVAALHPDAATFETWLRDQLATAPPRRRHDAVQLATIHTTKGLEWDHVVVYGANAGLMPHRLASDDASEREEERRIFHVAITRCRRSVAIIADEDSPSPYLTELSEPRGRDRRSA